MSKKILALLVVVLMVFALAACQPAASTAPAADTPSSSASTPAASTSTETEEPAEEPADEPETPAGDAYQLIYYMYSTTASDQDKVVEEAINEYILPLINCTVDFVMVSGGDWDEKARVPLQAGEKIDIFWTPEWMHYMENISQGLLLPLDDPDGPYGDLLHTYAEETIENLGAFIPANVVNGHLYGIATKKELCVPYGLMWNADYVEKYGIDITTVETLADMEPYLQQFIEDPANAGIYPLLTTGGVGCDSPFIQGFINNMEPISMRMGNPGEEQQPESYWEAPEMKEICLLVEKYYKAGYIHPDSYLTTYSNIDYLNQGQFLVSTDFVLKGGQVKANELMGQSGNNNLHLVEYQVHKNNSSGNTNVNVTTHAGGSLLGIPITSGNPVGAMQYINLMHIDAKLLNMMAWGVEGVHYNLNENGMVVPVDNNGWSNAHGGMWTLGDQFKQLIAFNEDPLKYEQMLALTAEAWNHCSLGFRFDPANYSNEFAAIKTVTDSYSRSMRTGVRVTEDYDSFVQQLYDAGLQTVLDAATEQYNAWKAENPTDPGAAWAVSN